ncbi:MAG: OadG family protein [Prevotella sp.]|nr:OadG family protein [Prevotella sp.]
MKRAIAFICYLTVGSVPILAQGAHNIVINEVLISNHGNILDEMGQRHSWVELANRTYSTYDVRGMYVTTDRAVLNNQMSVAERKKLMSAIPSEDERTLLHARQHLLLYLNSNPANGTLHLNAPTDTARSNWIALYDANGTDLIDSVTVPPLPPDMSYARVAADGRTWMTRGRQEVTPGIDNSFQTEEPNVSKWKREDPHGLVLSFLSMGIVFFCLALLYAFFRLLGTYMEQKMRLKAATEKHPSLMALQKAGQIMADTGHKTNVILKDGLKTKGIDKEIYVALISMALKEYLEDVHDVESDIITIKSKQSNWNNLKR